MLKFFLMMVFVDEPSQAKIQSRNQDDFLSLMRMARWTSARRRRSRARREAKRTVSYSITNEARLNLMKAPSA